MSSFTGVRSSGSHGPYPNHQCTRQSRSPFTLLDTSAILPDVESKRRAHAFLNSRFPRTSSKKSCIARPRFLESKQLRGAKLPRRSGAIRQPRLKKIPECDPSTGRLTGRLPRRYLRRARCLSRRAQQHPRRSRRSANRLQFRKNRRPETHRPAFLPWPVLSRGWRGRLRPRSNFRLNPNGSKSSPKVSRTGTDQQSDPERLTFGTIVQRLALIAGRFLYR